ncbi:MFS transporter [Faucicola boevrei]|uniref:MFS transporter n=1 Tax=Faucicola boevrei TaxID=346665 RepID=UPI000361AA05|nr:MFS transporter [Moraxella boevrei]
MSSQFVLFGSKRFTPMFFTQFLGAFNDNVFKQGLILVLTFMASAKLSMSVSLLNNLAAMLFVLPFFLFSALAGQLADKYDKAKLTRIVKISEIGIMALATFGFVFEIYTLLFLALFLMGTHSTFFGPVKYAYLPQAMHQDELVGANGLFQMGTSLAILTGMMTAGILTQQENALWWLSGFVLVVACLGYFSSRFVPNMPAPQPDLVVDWHIFRTSWQTIKYLFSLPIMWFTIMGNSWFWFYGATLTVQVPEFAKTILYGGESVIIFLLTLFSVGTALGSVLCKTFTKNQVSLKLLPFGIAGLTIFAIDLFLALSNLNLSMGEKTNFFSISQLLAIDGMWRIFLDLFLLGFSGGIYIVPLYAFMQAYAPKSHRARVIGANNIFNALFMVSSAVFAIVCLNVLKISLPMLFAVVGGLNLVVGAWVFVNLKKQQNLL